MTTDSYWSIESKNNSDKNMCFQIDSIKRFPSNHVNYSHIMSTEGTHSKKERKARAAVKNACSFQHGY